MQGSGIMSNQYNFPVFLLSPETKSFVQEVVCLCFGYQILVHIDYRGQLYLYAIIGELCLSEKFLDGCIMILGFFSLSVFYIINELESILHVSMFGFAFSNMLVVFMQLAGKNAGGTDLYQVIVAEFDLVMQV